jgi:hypothetical protein
VVLAHKSPHAKMRSGPAYIPNLSCDGTLAVTSGAHRNGTRVALVVAGRSIGQPREERLSGKGEPGYPAIESSGLSEEATTMKSNGDS